MSLLICPFSRTSTQEKLGQGVSAASAVGDFDFSAQESEELTLTLLFLLLVHIRTSSFLLQSYNIVPMVSSSSKFKNLPQVLEEDPI